MNPSRERKRADLADLEPAESVRRVGEALMKVW